LQRKTYYSLLEPVSSWSWIQRKDIGKIVEEQWAWMEMSLVLSDLSSWYLFTVLFLDRQYETRPRWIDISRSVTTFIGYLLRRASGWSSPGTIIDMTADRKIASTILSQEEEALPSMPLRIEEGIFTMSGSPWSRAR
jgi:hypothetical protein